MRRCDRAGSPTKIVRHFNETPRTFAIDPISELDPGRCASRRPRIKNSPRSGGCPPARAPRRERAECCFLSLVEMGLRRPVADALHIQGPGERHVDDASANVAPRDGSSFHSSCRTGWRDVACAAAFVIVTVDRRPPRTSSVASARAQHCVRHVRERISDPPVDLDLAPDQSNHRRPAGCQAAARRLSRCPCTQVPARSLRRGFLANLAGCVAWPSGRGPRGRHLRLRHRLTTPLTVRAHLARRTAPHLVRVRLRRRRRILHRDQPGRVDDQST